MGVDEDGVAGCGLGDLVVWDEVEVLVAVRVAAYD